MFGSKSVVPEDKKKYMFGNREFVMRSENNKSDLLNKSGFKSNKKIDDVRRVITAEGVRKKNFTVIGITKNNLSNKKFNI